MNIYGSPHVTRLRMRYTRSHFTITGITGNLNPCRPICPSSTLEVIYFMLNHNVRNTTLLIIQSQYKTHYDRMYGLYMCEGGHCVSRPQRTLMLASVLEILIFIALFDKDDEWRTPCVEKASWVGCQV